MGAAAYRILEQFNDFQTGEIVVEVGSERGEGSTEWLAGFCASHNIMFWTIDVDPRIFEEAVTLLRPYHDCIAYNGRAEDFLTDGDAGPIRFAYLDGFDCIPVGFEKEPFVDFHRRRYRELGLSMTNRWSQASHLVQAALVDVRSASRCAILIDDTSKTQRGWHGKGALAMPYLESRGFELSDLGGAGLATRA